MAKRQVFHSVLTKNGWVVKKGTITVGSYDTQLQAEKVAKGKRTSRVYERWSRSGGPA